MGFPGGAGGKESACQCREHRFDPQFGKIPHAERNKDSAKLCLTLATYGPMDL